MPSGFERRIRQPRCQFEIELAERLQPWNMAPGAAAELILTVYLLTFGLRSGSKLTSAFDCRFRRPTPSHFFPADVV